MERFAAELRAHDERKYRYTVELADLCSVAILHVHRKYVLHHREAVDAMLMTLVAYVQSHSSPDEWATAARILSEELRERLTIRQVG